MDREQDRQVSKPEFCTVCGIPTGVEAIDDALWDIYNRIDDGRSHYEPLVFDSSWLQENVMDEEDHAAVMGAMGKDMHNRGLCTKCGRPDLRGIDPSKVLSQEDADAQAEMYAEQAAERRMGA